MRRRAFRIVKQVTMFMLSEGKIWEQSSALQKEFKKKRKKIIFVVCTPQIHQRFAVKHDIVFRPPLTNLALKKKKMCRGQKHALESYPRIDSPCYDSSEFSLFQGRTFAFVHFSSFFSCGCAVIFSRSQLASSSSLASCSK